MKISVRLPGPIKVAVDTDMIARAVATDMLKHWLSNFLAGKQPDGTPLPLNKEGRPLGVGSGALARGWHVKRVGRGSLSATSAGVPSDRGRTRVDAITAMQRRGVRFQGLEGASEVAFVRISTHRIKTAIKLG